MPDNIKDAVVAAENRTFWTDQGIDPKGILRAAFSNATRQRTQGASTITQQYVKILYLTQERSYKRKVKEAILSLKIQQRAEQDGDPRGLPQHDLLRPRRLRHPGGREGVLRQRRQGPHPARVRGAGQRPQQPDRPRPGQRQGREGRAQGALPTTSSAAWPTPATSPPRRPTQAERRLPKFPKIQAESQYGGQKGHMLRMVRNELHAPRASATRQIDGGGLRVTTTFTQKAMDAAEQGVQEAAARGRVQRQGPPRRASPASSPAPARCAASTAARTTSSPRSTGRWPAAGRLDVQAVRAGRRRSRTGFSLKDTFDGNSPFDVPRRRSRSATRATDGGNDYGSAVQPADGDRGVDQHRVRRHDRLDARRPAEDPRDGRTRSASRRPRPSKAYSGIPDRSAAASSPDARDHARHGHGSARSTWPTPTRRSPTAASAPTCTSSTKVVDSNGEDLYDLQGQSTATPLDPGHRRRRLLRHAAGRAGRHRHGRARRSAARPPARPARRPTTRTRSSSAWFVGYTPQLATAGHVRPRQRQRAARRLAAVVLRCRLPGATPGPRSCSRTWRASTSRSSRRRPTSTARRPTDGHEPDADRRRRPHRPTKKPSADQGPERADRRADRRRRPTSRPRTPTAPDDEPTPTATPTPTPTPTPTSPTITVPVADADPSARPTAAAAPHGDRRRARRRASTPRTASRRRLLRWRRVTRPRRVPTADVAPVSPSTTTRSSRALSEGVGGPVGTRAGRHPWWTPVRRAAGADRGLLRARAWCRRAAATSDTGATTSTATRTCATPTCPTSTPGAGFAELRLALHRRPAGAGPLRGHGVPRRHLLLRLGRGLGDALG